MSFSTESRSSRTSTSTRTSTGTSTRSATHTQYSTTRTATIVSTLVWWLRAWRATTSGLRAATAWTRDTVTPAGWIIVTASLVLLPIGVVFGWIELLVAGVTAAALFLLSLPFLIGGRAYNVEFTLGIERIVAGGEAVGTLTVTNVSKRLELPGRVDVPIGSGLTDVYVPLLRAGHSHVEEVVVPAYSRGVIDVGPVTTVRTDPIGILRREVSWAEMHRLFVHPVTVPIPSTSSGFVRDLEGNPTSQIVDSDISFHAIREYAHGDGQRNVHWKSTAKTGKLMVRQFEETRRSRLAIVLALRADEFGSAEEFEMAVSAVGSLGIRAIRDGRDIAVVASQEIPEFAMSTVRSMRSFSVLSQRTLLDELSAIDSGPNMMPVEAVCALAAEVVADISIAFVICGSTMTPKRLQALSLKFAPGVAVVAVLCNPEEEPKFRDLAGTTVLTIGVLDDFRSLLARRAA